LLAGQVRLRPERRGVEERRPRSEPKSFPFHAIDGNDALATFATAVSEFDPENTAGHNREPPALTAPAATPEYDARPRTATSHAVRTKGFC